MPRTILTTLIVLIILAAPAAGAASNPVPPGVFTRSGSGAPPSPTDLRPALDLGFGHNTSLTGAAFSPDGRILATGCGENLVAFWDAHTGQLIRKIPTACHRVSMLAFLPDGRSLVFSDGGGAWRCRFVSGDCSGPPALEVMPAIAGITSLAVSAEFAYMGLRDSRVCYASLQTEDHRDLKPGHTGIPTCMAFSPDGAVLATGGEDSTVRLWNPRTWELLRVLRSPLRYRSMNPVGDMIHVVAFSPDGRTLATGSERSVIRLWDLNSGEIKEELPGHFQGTTGLSFSPDGAMLASAGRNEAARGSVRLWNLPEGTLRHELDAPEAFRLAFSAEGILAATGEDHRVLLYDSQSGRLLHVLGQPYRVWSVDTAPNGEIAASGHDDGTVKLWNIRTGDLKRVLRFQHGEVRAVAFSPDGIFMAVGAGDGSVPVLDATSFQPRYVLPAGQACCTEVRFSPNGQLLLTGIQTGMMRLWNTHTGSLMQTLTQPGSDYRKGAFSPDSGKLVLWGGSFCVQVWNLRTGASVTEDLDRWPGNAGHSPWLGGAVFLPDSQTVALQFGDGHHALYTPFSNRHSYLGNHWGGLALCSALSPDGRTAAYGTAANMVRLVTVRTGELSRSLNEAQEPINAVAYTRDGTRLLTASSDGAIRVYDVPHSRLLATLYAAPEENNPGAALEAQFLVVTPEGYYSGSAASDRYAHFLLGDRSYPAECFQQRYESPEMVKQALSGRVPPPVGSFHGPYPPTCVFTAPDPGARANGSPVQVTITATDDSEVTGFDLFINGARVHGRPIQVAGRPFQIFGRPIQVSGRPLDDGTAPNRVSVSYTTLVPLPPGRGAVKLQAVAFDNDGLQSPRAELILQGRDDPAGRGRLLGLCVGISQYQDPSLRLACSSNDAVSLAAILNRQRGIYSGADVRALTDEQATAPAIRASLDRLAASAAPDDTVVISLSGHGCRTGPHSFYFGTYEIDRRSVAETSLPWTDVILRLRTLSEHCRRVIVLLDACHSGSVATNEDLVRAVLNANAGVMVFASSRGSELSLEYTATGHGAFTQAIIDALDGAVAVPGGKSLSFWDFAAAVRRRVKELTGSLQNPQVPLWQDFDADAPFFGPSAS